MKKIYKRLLLTTLLIPNVAYATSMDLTGIPWLAILVVSMLIAYIKSFRYKGPKHIGFLLVVASTIGPIIISGIIFENNIQKFNPPYGSIIFLLSAFSPLVIYYVITRAFSKHVKIND